MNAAVREHVEKVPARDGSQNTAKGPQSMQVKENAHSRVKRVIGVVSGKGGVGKSMVTSLLAVAMNRKGYKDSNYGR